MVQTPHDIHGSATLVADIIRSTKERIRCSTAGILLEFTDEQQHFTALFLVVDVALAGSRFSIGRGLALPVEEPRADRVIIVQCSRRIILI